MPRIVCKLFGGNLGGEMGAGDTQSLDIELHVAWSKWFEVGQSKVKEADSRSEAAPILWMSRPEELLLQMDKGTRDLNQALEEAVIFVMTFQP